MISMLARMECEGCRTSAFSTVRFMAIVYGLRSTGRAARHLSIRSMGSIETTTPGLSNDIDYSAQPFDTSTSLNLLRALVATPETSRGSESCQKFACGFCPISQ